MKHFRLIIFSTLILFIACTISAQTNNHNVIHEEKISFSFGIGHEYSLLGFRLNYKLTDKVALMASLAPLLNLGYFDMGGALPKVGVEYSFPKLFASQRLVPYANASYGVASSLRVGRDLSKRLLHKAFLGPTLGLGTKFKIFKKMRSYGNIGIQYVIINQKARRDFVDNYQDHIGGESDYSDLSLSLGYTLILNQ